MSGIPFQFDVQADFFEKADEEAGKRRRIGGIISTESADRQGETVLADGLDFSDWTKNGWYNDNHTKDTDGIVGYPDYVKSFRKGQKLPNGQTADKSGHWAEGYMLGTERANRLWDLGKALQGTGRKLGFSVEGKILRRAGPKTIAKKADDGSVEWVGNRIAKALVRNVAITNCFPGDVRVVGAGEKITRREYSGPMVEVVLVSGQKLSGTPNHPVFTQRGWVALGELDEGHDCVGCYSSDLLGAFPLFAGSAAVVPHDVQHMPTTFQELFDLARDNASGFSHWIRSIGKGEFHGDVIVDSKIDVVLIHGLLRRYLASTFSQQFGQDALPAADKELSLFSRLGSLVQNVGRILFPQLRLTRPIRPLFSLVGGQLAIAPQLFLSACSRNAGPASDVEHAFPGNGVAGGDCGRALSQSIGFKHISSYRIFDFSGHVFNLDTQHGWYGANGIVAHNCPVNTDTGLEILARSITAVEMSDPDDLESRLTVLEKAMAMGPAQPSVPVALRGPQTGVGAGAVTTPKDLESDENPPKELAGKSLTIHPTVGIAPTTTKVTKPENKGFKHIRPPTITKPPRMPHAKGPPGQPADPKARAMQSQKRSSKGKITEAGTGLQSTLAKTLPYEVSQKSLSDEEAFALVRWAIPAVDAATAGRIVELTKALKRSGRL